MKIIGIYKTQQSIESPEVVQGVDEPLGLEHILGIAESKGHEVDLFLPKKLSDLEGIINANPDIVLYSPTTNQINFNIELNKKIKNKTNPLSIIGGYHVSAQPLVIQKGFDFGVLGEGEETFRELLNSIEKNQNNYRKIKGIAFSENGNLIFNERRKRIKDLDSLPKPFRTKRVFKQKSNYLAYPPTEERKTALIEYSRGCTFDCGFCASPNVLGRKIVYRKPEIVINQLKDLKNDFGVNYVFFTDLNMTLNPKKVEDLTDALIKEDIGIYFNFMSGFKNINNRLLKKLKDSGCVKISWGMENISGDISDETNKLPPLQRMREILDYSADVGIMNEGFIMIGWPNETEKELERTIENLPKYNLHMIRPSIYTPFPGTLDYGMINGQGSITEKDWSKYDTNNLVFDHPSLNNKQLRKYQKEIIKTFYQSEEYKQRVKNFTKEHPKYKKSFDDFLSILKV